MDIDTQTNPAFVIFSLVAPMLIAVVKQQGFSTQVNAMIAFAGYIVVGIAGALVVGPFTFENAVAFVTTATVIGTAAYKLIWSNLGKGVATDLSVEEKLRNVTSLKKAA